jgi:hypothetical protein
MQRYYLVFVTITLTAFSCTDSGAVLKEQTLQQNQNKQSSKATYEELKSFTNYFIKEDSLSYKDYRITKLKKTVNDENTAFRPVEITYLVIKQNENILSEFDSVYFPLGNATKFGLFSFLGGKEKQLAISQTVPRGGRHWLVELYPEYRVLFDSKDYEVGREDVVILDIDKDGVYEISLPVTAFYGVFNIAEAGTPLPNVIFKYDKQTKSYLPANHLYRDYLLRGINTEIEELKGKGAASEYRVLDILLDYLYAGREDEGWTFFDREYNLPDKEKVRGKIRQVLMKAPAYKYIHANGAT